MLPPAAGVGMLLSVTLCVVVCCVLYCAWTVRKRYGNSRKSGLTVGFLHPSCGAGGGGERVLWLAVRALVERRKSLGWRLDGVVVYGGDGNDVQLREIVKNQFGLDIAECVEIVPLRSGKWTNGGNFPVATLLLQALTGCVVTGEALSRRHVDILVETSAHAFAPIAARLFGVAVVSYIHYPTISADMLQAVQDRRVGINNSRLISSSRVASALKLVYYKIFAILYRYAGTQSAMILANSSWTKGHLQQIFGENIIIDILFPPCDVQSLKRQPLDRQKEPGLILSLAQFRPEKNHELQLEVLALLVHKHAVDQVKLLLIGGVRNDQDRRRVESLKALAERLDVASNCEFKINASREELVESLSLAQAAIHTMREEHFGISIVELMAAGTVVVAHNSGGVMTDILEHGRSGFLADDAKSYAASIKHVLTLPEEAKHSIQTEARYRAEHFTDEQFTAGFILKLSALLSSASARLSSE